MLRLFLTFWDMNIYLVLISLCEVFVVNHLGVVTSQSHQSFLLTSVGEKLALHVV